MWKAFSTSTTHHDFRVYGRKVGKNLAIVRFETYTVDFELGT
jgi:hypothetical protein